MANGESFLTKPGKTILMVKKIIKKITNINPKLSTTEAHQMQDLLKNFSLS